MIHLGAGWRRFVLAPMRGLAGGRGGPSAAVLLGRRGPLGPPTSCPARVPTSGPYSRLAWLAASHPAVPATCQNTIKEGLLKVLVALPPVTKPCRGSIEKGRSSLKPPSQRSGAAGTYRVTKDKLNHTSGHVTMNYITLSIRITFQPLSI